MKTIRLGAVYFLLFWGVATVGHLLGIKFLFPSYVLFVVFLLLIALATAAYTLAYRNIFDLKVSSGHCYSHEHAVKLLVYDILAALGKAGYASTLWADGRFEIVGCLRGIDAEPITLKGRDISRTLEKLSREGNDYLNYDLENAIFAYQAGLRILKGPPC